MAINFKNVTPVEANELIKKTQELLILDVRTVDEYRNGHIKGAKLIPVHLLSAQLAEITDFKDKPVLVYCASGGRSPSAVKVLMNNNFTNIYHLSTGISSWFFGLER